MSKETGERVVDYEAKLEPSRIGSIIQRIYRLVIDRREHPVDGSYTNYLISKGRDKIIQKYGEESVELVIAAKNGDKDQIAHEAADVIYHFSVLLSELDLSPDDVAKVLEDRRDAADS